MDAGTKEIILSIVAAFGAGLLVGLSRLVTSVSKALSAKARWSKARSESDCRRRVIEIEAVFGAMAATDGFLREAEPGKLTPELEALETALIVSGAPIVAGVVCSKDKYVLTLNFKHLLGHENMAGCRWDDERFVDPQDLPASREVAKRSIVGRNEGEVVRIRTASGVVLTGRVWSGRLRAVGDRHYRFFVVCFEA